MQAPVGFGKTVLAAELVQGARKKNKRVLFTVPAISLVDQTVEMFHKQGIHDIGVIQATHEMTDWGQPVQVASVQTLQKRTLPRADVVLIDECHKWFKFYEKWLRDPEWAKVPMIGLSATPWTKGLGSYFDELIVASTTERLIAEGSLSKFRVYAPSHPDLKDVRTVAGDYHEGELADKMNRAELVADVVETWKKRAFGRPTLCFAVDRAHAKHIQQKFEVSGIPCGYQDAYTKDFERTIIKQKFHRGELPVVVSVGTLTTGIDWDVRCISMCRPTKSAMLMVQIIGRGLRTAKDKQDLLVLDHSDNHLRLGFITDIDASYAGLHSGKTKNNERDLDKIRLPKECPECSFLKPPKVAKCPACGFICVAHTKVDVGEGELQELKAGKKKVQKVPGEKKSIYAGLLFVAKEKGFKPGWVSHNFREIFGVWPVNLKYTPPSEPSFELSDWLRRMRINYVMKKKYVEQKAKVNSNSHVNGNGHAAPTEAKPSSPATSSGHVQGTFMTEDDFNAKW